ncbi:tRNA (5-methylaminomethyl-2-thiouridine)(34)-methyltransferase MnmD [Gammaproteobacteria bacterium]|nr:tRNA (5-methylaminomethyl-2-thiouridine)(34)-methyltransferase MnmD [Gammaproteobacteria bacterium]MDB4059569.1 tRNA (5-methylaminomethyl-2-thiouridine)(34)-methyltransferase MnmD [Gammaproteobacteria bacterium]MDC1190859.1 tRNA (5-methylaminomethyl-2-thiouridine)(34)-methyltransferase MnmD [Gammaproteobacteria bacterium]
MEKLPKIHPLKKNSRKVDWINNEPFSIDHDDRFFQADAVEETSEVFINANNLYKRWDKLNGKNFTIGELGFGFGLNFLITAKAWKEANGHNSNWLDYISIDCFSLDISDFKKVAKLYPLLEEVTQEFIKFFPQECNGFTRIELPGYKIRLTLIVGDAEESLCSLVGNKSNKIDAWYLDGFDPNKNLSMWSPCVIKQIGLLSKDKCTFGTYTAAGFVRRELQNNNFDVSKVKGFGNKRHRLKGVFSGDDEENISDNKLNKVAVIGSGIAGSCIAFKLARQDIQVDIFEKAEELDLNPWAAMYPKFSLGVDSRSDLLAAGYFYSSRFYREILESYKETGILFLNNGIDRDSWIKRLLKLDREDLFELLDVNEINTQNKINQEFEGLLVKLGGCISIKELNKILLQEKKINLYKDHHFLDYKIKNNIGLEFNNQKSQEGYSHLIICSGESLQNTIPRMKLKYGAIGGMKKNNLSEIKYPINNNGYVLPMHEGTTWAGSIYSNAPLPNAESIDFKEIIIKNSNILDDSDVDNLISSWKGVRTSLPDYLPVAGPINNNGIYVIGGLGSRGLSLAPLLAEMVMNDICKTPSPVSKAVGDAINPLRFMT